MCSLQDKKIDKARNFKNINIKIINSLSANSFVFEQS